jgi:hypothetical protein
MSLQVQPVVGNCRRFVSFYSALGNFVEPHSLSHDYSESIECLKWLFGHGVMSDLSP